MDIAIPNIIHIDIFNSNTVFKNMAVTKKRKTCRFEIEIPIEASGISYIDSEEMKLRPGVIICAKPGQTRHTKLPFKCYYLHLTLPEGELYSRISRLPNFIKTDKYEWYCSQFQKLREYHITRGDATDLMLHSLVFEILYSLIRDSEKQLLKNQVQSDNYTAIRKTLSFIENNPNVDLSLSALSAFSGYSPTHFHKLFKSVTGETVHDYVEKQRIKKAVNLLVTTDFTLSQIAYECGFSSQSYFSYAFRRAKNMTPREYAKEVLKKYSL